jgi:CMP-N,N'-diacetyllegionaminic acid synthase
MTKCVCLIPARSGSKRVLGKNVKHLGGRPLIAYTIRAALDSGVFGEGQYGHDVWVSTDDNSYADVARNYGAHSILRPDEYATDTSPDIEWVRHALEYLAKRGAKYDAFAILRPTSPFRMPATIRRAWEVFCRYGPGDIDSIRAVEPCAQHPYKMWITGYETPLIFPMMGAEHDFYKAGVPGHSRQYADLPPIYVQNASLEISWVKTVFEKGSIAGNRIVPFFTEGHEGFDVNHPLDWDMAEMLVERGEAVLPPDADAVHDSWGQYRNKAGTIAHLDKAYNS